MFRNRKSYTMKYIPSYIPRIISITMLYTLKIYRTCFLNLCTMRKKEQMFWLASRSRMWRIPLCMAAFSLLPSAYSFASAETRQQKLYWQ